MVYILNSDPVQLIQIPLCLCYVLVQVTLIMTRKRCHLMPLHHGKWYAFTASPWPKQRELRQHGLAEPALQRNIAEDTRCPTLIAIFDLFPNRNYSRLITCAMCAALARGNVAWETKDVDHHVKQSTNHSINHDKLPNRFWPGSSRCQLVRCSHNVAQWMRTNGQGEGAPSKSVAMMSSPLSCSM